MKFILSNKYLLEVDFPSSEFLSKYRENMMDIYEDFIKSEDKKTGNDIILQNTPINEYFGDKIKKVVENSFNLPPSNADIAINLYIQNSQNGVSIFHNHIHTPATICGVFYLDIPNEGGELEISMQPPKNIKKFKPQEDKLYLFPPWLFHRPLPQKDQKPRFCFNFQYITDSRPIMKKFGFIW